MKGVKLRRGGNEGSSRPYLLIFFVLVFVYGVHRSTRKALEATSDPSLAGGHPSAEIPLGGAHHEVSHRHGADRLTGGDGEDRFEFNGVELPKPDPNAPRPRPALARRDVIPVRVSLYRMISTNKSSILMCHLPLEALEESMRRAARIWRDAANIELIYDPSFPVRHVTPEMEVAYEQHMRKFTHGKGPAAAANDLKRIVDADNVSGWWRGNAIHVFCIGRFVGNNAVTINQKVFIRTLSYKKTELPMDVPRFSRVLTHEIGHALDLRHPSFKFCRSPCDLHECNLMCQMRLFPNTIDSRYALALNQEQIGISRRMAASWDIPAAGLTPGQVMHGFSTQRLVSAKSLLGPVIFLGRPVETNLRLSQLRVRFTRFRGCKVALVAASRLGPREGKIVLRLLAYGSLENVINHERDGEEEQSPDFARRLIADGGDHPQKRSRRGVLTMHSNPEGVESGGRRQLEDDDFIEGFEGLDEEPIRLDEDDTESLLNVEDLEEEQAHHDDNDDAIKEGAFNEQGLTEDKSTEAAASRSELRFGSYVFSTWWNANRHVEASIEPPVLVKKDEFIGIVFSSSLVALGYASPMRNDGSFYNIPRAARGELQPWEANFDRLIRHGELEVPATDTFHGMTPLLNVVGDPA